MSSPVELKAPSAGESVTEVEIADWLKGEGETVAKDEAVLVLETDKATMEISSPIAGRLSRQLKKKGERVKVGDVLGLIEPGATTSSGSPPTAKTPPVGTTPKPESKPPAVADSTPTPTPTGAPTPGTGGPDPREEIVPMSLLRRKIAERLVAAQHTAALLTTFNEIDMSAVVTLRKELQESFLERYKIKLGFMSFFVKAVISGLQEIPQLNAEIRGTHIVYRKHHDIGVAIGGGRGLVVPVLRGAGRMSFAEIEQGIAGFARKVKENKITPDELQGGTFTLTNGGIYGSLLSTPLVNPPQSGVFGMHAIQDRPIAVQGQVVIRPMMYVALTYDHRLVDGREAVLFLRHVKELIESPARMLIEV